MNSRYEQGERGYSAYFGQGGQRLQERRASISRHGYSQKTQNPIQAESLRSAGDCPIPAQAKRQQRQQQKHLPNRADAADPIGQRLVWTGGAPSTKEHQGPKAKQSQPAAVQRTREQLGEKI